MKRARRSWLVIYCASTPAQAAGCHHAGQMINFSIRKKCAGLRPRFDTDALSEGSRLFHGQFPNAEALRNAVAHSAENVSSSDALDGSSMLTFLMEPMVRGASIGKSMLISSGRKTIRFEPSTVDAATLSDVRALIFDAVRPAIRYGQRRPRTI